MDAFKKSKKTRESAESVDFVDSLLKIEFSDLFVISNPEKNNSPRTELNYHEIATISGKAFELAMVNQFNFVIHPTKRAYIPEIRLSFFFLRILKAKRHGLFVQNALGGFRPKGY